MAPCHHATPDRPVLDALETTAGDVLDRDHLIADEMLSNQRYVAFLREIRNVFRKDPTFSARDLPRVLLAAARGERVVKFKDQYVVNSWIPLCFGNVLEESVQDLYHRLRAATGISRRRCWAKEVAGPLAGRELPLGPEDSSAFCRSRDMRPDRGDFFKTLLNGVGPQLRMRRRCRNAARVLDRTSFPSTTYNGSWQESASRFGQYRKIVLT